MPRYIQLSLRFAILAVISLAGGQALPALAQSQSLMNGASPAALLAVDIPASNTMVSNGQFLDIGGWTAGSRVDVYLDGPAGFGEGIGSNEVDEARPDVASKIDPGLAESGFDVPWLPMDLSAGTHTLYVYSLIDGQWSAVQTRTITGEGNVIPNPSSGEGQDDAAPASAGNSDSGSSAAF